MRTLKKTLSLLLAVALVLSLTVVGASAYENKVDDFGDVAEIGDEYLEAVGVMSGLGIIEGYDDGNFKPATSYTREQAAKIIAYMQLGPDAAEKLACTVSPFTDVDAGRWSAGYIAYAKDAGILDGMGDGSFDPTGTLTGFQWAKMLLCAVGYGENGEFTGSEWSINTAKVAQTVKLFAGDLTGMTNGVINREQAVLYAFNTLTTLGIVVYSPALGDYIFSYNDKIFDRVTPEGTLGGVVYGLKSVKGIIIDNEGMGADKTVVSVTGSYSKAPANAAADKQDVSVSADTDLDMMYHAAKIWYTGSGAVYVMDLATVESLTCHDITPAAVNKLERGKTVTDKVIGENGSYYEYNLIDNTAIDANYAAVDFFYGLGTLGTRSETKDTTVVAGKAYANSDILTDISKISRRAEVIYIATKSTTSTGEACHVYPVTYTTGTIADFSRVNQTITLSDGTVYHKSAFAADTWLNDADFNKTVTIALDTHGHVIRLNAESARTVAYYTGTVRNSSPHEAWYSDAALVAQFADLETGTEFEVPVTTAWAAAADNLLAGGTHNGYYDITDTVSGTSTNYAPKLVTEAGTGPAVYGNDDYTSYAFEADSVTFDADSYRFPVSYGSGSRYVYYDNDEVTFIIASGIGSTFDTKVITGVDNLLAYFSDNYTVDSVNLTALGMTGAYDAQDVFHADTIFAYKGAVVTSGTLFFPYNVDECDDIGALYRYEGGYLNGTKVNWPVYLDNDDGIVRGFYTFDVDVATNEYTLTKVTDYKYGMSSVVKVGSSYYVGVGGVANATYNASEAIVVDLRVGAALGEVDSIADLSDLYYDDYNDYHESSVLLAFTYSGNNVSVIYVLDAGFNYQAVLSLSTELQEAGWHFYGPNVINDSTALVRVLLYNANVDSERIYSTVTLGGDFDPSTLSLAPYVKDGKRVENVFMLSGIDPQYNSDRYAEVEISDITLGQIAFSTDSTYDAVYSNPAVVSAGTTLGEEIVATWTAKNAGAIDISKTWYMTIEYYDPSDVLVDTVKAEVKSTDGNTLSVTLNPICGGIYKLVSVTETEPMNWDL